MSDDTDNLLREQAWDARQDDRERYKRHARLVVVLDCTVYDEDLRMGGDAPGPLSLTTNVASFIEARCGRGYTGEAEPSYTLDDVTVFEAASFGAALVDALVDPSGVVA